MCNFYVNCPYTSKCVPCTFNCSNYFIKLAEGLRGVPEPPEHPPEYTPEYL